MSAFWNMFSRKSKDKDPTKSKSDTKSSTLVFSTDGGTTVAGSAITSYKSKYKSNSKGSSSKTTITVTTNKTISQEQGFTLLRQLDQVPMLPVMSSSKSATSSYKSTEIQKSISTRATINPASRDAVPFNTPYVSPYKTSNIQTIHTPALLPSGSKTFTSSYQSPYRNSSQISSVENKKAPLVSVSRTQVPTTVRSTINPTTTKIWNPMTSVISSKPVTSTWNNSSSITPKTSSLTVNQKPPEASVIKPKRKQSPGVVYIFHNDKFDSPDKEFREGSAVDVRLLKKTFQSFKMSINAYENFTVKEVNNAVQKIEKKDFGSYSCIVVVILTHGTRYGTVAARDGSYSIDDNVLFPILRNSSLRSKPKLFFIQACKGSMEPGHFHKDAMQPSGVPEEILKCYSTFEGYVAYRTDKGTFFIKSLCELLQEHGKTKNIKDIMDLVIKRVKETSGNKQIPSYETTLTEPYIFGDYI